MASSSPAIPRRETTAGRQALFLGMGAVLVATTVVALIAQAVGAGADFPALKPAVYLPFAIVGLVAGYVGWRIVRSRAAHPGRVLRVLIPVVLVLSLIPDVVLLVTGFIPGTTTTGVIALMLMHVLVAAIGIPLYQRIAPVTL